MCIQGDVCCVSRIRTFLSYCFLLSRIHRHERFQQRGCTDIVDYELSNSKKLPVLNVSNLLSDDRYQSTSYQTQTVGWRIHHLVLVSLHLHHMSCELRRWKFELASLVGNPSDGSVDRVCYHSNSSLLHGSLKGDEFLERWW